MSRHIFADSRVKEEFFDRFPELVGQENSGLESTTVASGGLDVMPVPEVYPSTIPTIDHARSTVEALQEGGSEQIEPGLEAIILRFGRPAYFIREDSFDTTNAVSSSNEVNQRVNAAKETLENWIPSVGRVNTRDHLSPWQGTGWIVAPGVVVTNRHVASTFAQLHGDEFVLNSTGGKKVKPELNMKEEHQIDKEKLFEMPTVLWIEPPDSPHDVAFLSIADRSYRNEVLPQPISLMEQEQYNDLPVDHWTAIIGYPARSPYNDAQDQQRIFEGVFNVKRLQPGVITSKTSESVSHDATTLGGNSGSVLLDLESGSAVALHWGGLEGERNSAVAAPKVKQLLLEKVLNIT